MRAAGGRSRRPGGWAGGPALCRTPVPLASVAAVPPAAPGDRNDGVASCLGEVAPVMTPVLHAGAAPQPGAPASPRYADASESRLAAVAPSGAARLARACAAAALDLAHPLPRDAEHCAYPRASARGRRPIQNAVEPRRTPGRTRHARRWMSDCKRPSSLSVRRQRDGDAVGHLVSLPTHRCPQTNLFRKRER